MPTFESGRLAGLGLDLGDVAARRTSAWDATPAGPQPASFPYYHRWYFRTGASGDFETLVRLLVPEAGRPARRHPRDGRAGARVRTCRGLDKPELGGILKLGGALQPPDAGRRRAAAGQRYETWDDYRTLPAAAAGATSRDAGQPARRRTRRAGRPRPDHRARRCTAAGTR